MILCETYPFLAHRNSRLVRLKSVSLSKANLQIHFQGVGGSARVQRAIKKISNLSNLSNYILKSLYANFPEKSLQQWRDNGFPPTMTIYGLRTVTRGGVARSGRGSRPLLPLESRCEIGGGIFLPFFFAEKIGFLLLASDSVLLHFSFG